MTPTMLIGWSFAILFAVGCACGVLFFVCGLLSAVFVTPHDEFQIRRRMSRLEAEVEKMREAPNA